MKKLILVIFLMPLVVGYTPPKNGHGHHGDGQHMVTLDSHLIILILIGILISIILYTAHNGTSK